MIEKNDSGSKFPHGSTKSWLRHLMRILCQKQNKKIIEEREDLSKKLGMLRLRIQEREAREAEIDSEIANVLVRNAEINE